MKKYKKFLLLLLLIPLSVNAESINYVACGESTDIPASLPVLSSNLINAVKIAVPIILIIMGMIDFFKATVASDEKAMNESKQKFIKRAIAAVVVFLVIAIVQLSFNFLSNYNDIGGNITSCMNCFLNNDCQAGVTYDSNGNCSGCGCYDETECGSHSNNCEWKNNSCISNSSSVTTKTCADYRTTSECGADSNCKWDSGSRFCESK